MNKPTSNFLFPLIALIILVFALSNKMFFVPPLGKLLDPFIGGAQNDKDQNFTGTKLAINSPELNDSVQVYFDDRKVPHIYAENNKDLYYAQGYVSAYLRLWQMDFTTYASAGRLSEIFKDGFLEYDRVKRRVGMITAAKKSLELIEKDPETIEMLTAYTKGVNAYIKQLNYKNMPFEYKFLDYEPEPWSNLKSVLIMKYMANTMTGYEQDLSMSNMMLALGEEKFNKLFPNYDQSVPPVMNTSAGKLNNSLIYTKKPEYLDNSFLSSGTVISKSTYNPKLGSNSWAVSGKKTKSGFPILCNDPHLGLTFPNVWVEMQLSSPEMNVYGVSIPGAPAIIIGFNEKIAWGITNGATDVRDWYKLKITDDYKKYEYDGKWVNLKHTIEEIKRKGQRSFYDTVYTTIQGPIVIDKSFPETPELLNHALKWELQNPSNEFLTFHKLNKAKNYKDYKEAIKTYSCPIQNFTFAGNDNTIAINHQGKMSVRWAGEGRFVLDGTKSSHVPTKYIPVDSLPQELNPVSNYVLSANQQPTNADYPYYYSGFYSKTRAVQINKMLQKENKFDIHKMEAMQLDNTNPFAVEALPVLIQKIDQGKLSALQKKELLALSSWKGTYNINDENAELYELWWKNVQDYTWDELKSYTFYEKSPDDNVLLSFIQKDPSNVYFDKLGTSKKENAGDIITEAFIVATTDYNKMKKEGQTKWGDFNTVNIMHLTNIRALSTMNLPSAGHPNTINATSKSWGQSWRMIVELGDRPKAYGIYPGGQSGNPGSKFYDSFVSDWNHGKYYELQFFMTKAEAKKSAANSWSLK